MKNKLIYLFNQLMFTRDFSKKLDQNFHALTYPERAVYWLFVRPSWTAEKRFFYEACLMIPGQMYIADRKALYDMVMETKPDHCFEIGTYTGGGSTYFLAAAFQKLGKGKLITLENDNHLYNKAVNSYKKYLPTMAPFVEFIFGDSVGFFKDKLKEYKSVKCLFLDGAEDSSQTQEQYEKFFPYFVTGTVMAMHDWNTEKMESIKKLILSDPKWKLVKEINPPASVGFAIVERL